MSKVLVGYSENGLHHLQRHVIIVPSASGVTVAKALVKLHLELSALNIAPCDVRWAVLDSSTLYYHKQSGSWRVWIPKMILNDTWWK